MKKKNRSALVVGIDLYSHRPLRYCVNDAREVASILAAPEYGFGVELLENEEATRRVFLERLARLRSEENEVVLVYFAGHGASTDLGSYLVMHDSDNVDLGVELAYLGRAMNAFSEHTSIVAILDCCHSGAASIRSGDDVFLNAITLDEMKKALPVFESSRVVLAACQPSEVALEKPSLDHGVFTYYLLEALYGDAADSTGCVTVNGIYDQVAQQMSQTVGQTPLFRGDISGRLTLGRGLTPRERADAPEATLARIDREAQQLVDDYLGKTAIDVNEHWMESGYRNACALLDPLLLWFEKMRRRHPQLVSRPGFAAASQTAFSKLADLARINIGAETRYGVVDEKLGFGSFGTVWKIQSKGRSFAYKIYHPMELDNLEKRSRFERGYEAMRMLDHAHIVKVHDLSRCPIGFTMDFVEGPNARQYVSVDIDARECVFQLLTIAETLQHAHERGVIHRDVKPENIIMSWDDERKAFRPYLTDFDLAWFSTATRLTQEAIGTFAYAAPEQLASGVRGGPRSPTLDVFAFGQLVFFFLAARDPVFGVADNHRALDESLRHRFTEWQARELSNLYRKATEPRASERFPMMRDICDILYGCVQSLKPGNQEQDLEIDEFIRELVFACVGMLRENADSDSSFTTPSNRTFVEVLAHARSASLWRITLRLHLQIPPSVPGLSHEKARQGINQRLDSMLNQFERATRKPGRLSPFETFIHVDQGRLNMGTVRSCRSIVTRAVDCIESIGYR